MSSACIVKNVSCIFPKPTEYNAAIHEDGGTLETLVGDSCKALKAAYSAIHFLCLSAQVNHGFSGFPRYLNRENDRESHVSIADVLFSTIVFLKFIVISNVFITIHTSRRYYLLYYIATL